MPSVGAAGPPPPWPPPRPGFGGGGPPRPKGRGFGKKKKPKKKKKKKQLAAGGALAGRSRLPKAVCFARCTGDGVWSHGLGCGGPSPYQGGGGWARS